MTTAYHIKPPVMLNVLATLNKHPLDERIVFEEASHTYTIDGSTQGWKSCTGFLHCFFKPFVPDEVIANMMRSPKWPQSKYFGKTPDEIKKQWTDSSSFGTQMHLDIETYYNSLKGDESMFASWSPDQSPEWSMFLDYHERVGSTFEPYRTEWVVFDIYHKIAGSIDMVYKKPDGTLAIYDWKRVEDIKTENRWDHGLGPLAHLPDTNYWHYTVQLNVYKYILERYYDVTVSELALIVIHPSRPTWKRYRLNILTDEMDAMMAARARALESDSDAVVVF